MKKHDSDIKIFSYHNLEIGDLIFHHLENQDSEDRIGAHAHISIISKADIETNKFEAIRVRGNGENKFLIETFILTREQLDKLPYECNIVRFNQKNQLNIQDTVKILKDWCKWAVKSDINRVIKGFEKVTKESTHMESFRNEYFTRLQNFNPKKSITTLKDITKITQENFDIKTVMKFAARREISPTRPKEFLEDETGFNCLQAILIALQITFIKDDIQPINDKWISNKYPGRFSAHFFRNDEEIKLKERIPEPLRLDAKNCPIDIFRIQLLNSGIAKFLGVLKAPLEKDVNTIPTYEISVQTCKKGLENRTKLKESLNLP